MLPLCRFSATWLFRLQIGHRRLAVNSALVRSFTSRGSTVTFIGKPYKHLLCQSTSKTFRLIPVRRIYFNPETKEFVFDPLMMIVCGISVLYFAMKTIFAEMLFNRNHLLKDRNGNPVMMKKELLKELYTVLEESNIEGVYKTMDLAQFYFAKELEPTAEGSFLSRFGVFFGLPVYLNYAVENGDRQADLDVFLSHFGIDKSRLDEVNDDGKSVLEQLEDCLSLSPQARRYMLISLLYTASTPVDPFLNTVLLAAAPLTSYSIYKRMFKVPNNVALSSLVFGGYLVACFSLYVLKFLQQRYGSWATFSYECEDSDTAREELRNGAIEYLQKLSQLQEIVNKYSTNSAKKPSLWNDYQVCPAKKRLADLAVFAQKDCSITSVVM